ncbi:DUF5317 domain-containing protein [Bacillus sp. V5-8f]|uniref:DUF5317 domain-containing protein n=1 Tax=Bacillus sp. V5-8f TaxID=2053044 RepID=UPI0015E12D0D|nr:DUF5317 domain-containing protein [Bacillus sp. V5-8f]
MVFDGILLSLLIGFLRGGNLYGLATLKIRWGAFFPLLLLFEVTIFIFQHQFSWLETVSGHLYILIYIVGLLFLWVNRIQPGFMVILLGVLLNFIVISINGGRMPVSMEAAKILDPFYIETLKNGVYAKHTLLTEHTRLGFLGDIIPITNPYPKDQVVSIGDIVMNIGIFLFIQSLMVIHKGNSLNEGGGVNEQHGRKEGVKC